jgi:hypothetical protein
LQTYLLLVHDPRSYSPNETQLPSMKLIALVFATLATVTSARDFNLRAAAIKFLHAESSDPADARIIVHGLIDDASAEDLEIISKSAVAAYNSAYAATGHSITAFKTKYFFPIPDTDDFRSTELVFVQIVPGGSVKNDAVASLRMKTTNFEDIHKQFEDNFCGLLRVSSSANLVNARDCSLSFLDTPGESDLVPSESAYASTNGDATEAQVIIHGTLDDFTEKEFALINPSIESAYNEAYTKAGYTINDFEAKTVIDMPTGCRSCSRGKDAMMLNASKMIFARIQLGCQDCNPDDSSIDVVLKDSQIALMHQAFERSFCTKLKNSGLANFANIHDCSFRFVYNPVGQAESAQQ